MSAAASFFAVDSTALPESVRQVLPGVMLVGIATSMSASDVDGLVCTSCAVTVYTLVTAVAGLWDEVWADRTGVTLVAVFGIAIDRAAARRAPPTPGGQADPWPLCCGRDRAGSFKAEKRARSLSSAPWGRCMLQAHLPMSCGRLWWRCQGHLS
jgi:hypothetical protein